MSMLREGLLIRIQDRFTIGDTDECWEWTGQINNWGYGLIWLDGRKHPAHRVFHSMFNGEIPEGFQVDHICRNKVCVNPAHLQAITKSENVALGRLRKTHCPSGHSLEDAPRRGNGHRRCRECNRLACAKYRAGRTT